MRDSRASHPLLFPDSDQSNPTPSDRGCSFLFGVSAFDPPALALVAILVLILASLASLLPAQRAASIDPMSVLRSE
jgi:hypothetical protein